MKELGIYIHIPFCKRKCYYCDFVSFENCEMLVEQYIATLKNEIISSFNSLMRNNILMREDKKEINKHDSIGYENCNDGTRISRNTCACCEEKYKIRTVYIGGGTPSFIDVKYINEIIKLLNFCVYKYENKLENADNQDISNHMNAICDPNFNEKNKRYEIKNEIKDEIKNEIKNEIKEITIEVNPGTVNREKLKSYREMGINRLSIGLQSTNDILLEKIGRIHRYEDFLNTYRLAREIGFKNINVDLMLGLPDQTLDMLKDSVNKIIELEPEHISVYSLILEEGTKLEQIINSGDLKLPSEDIEREMYWAIKCALEEAGYIHYEISNFAKPGFMSHHNLDCWNQREYIGFGLSAHSYINGVRYCNSSEMDEYLKKNSSIYEDNVIYENKEINEFQTNYNAMQEFMMLGLRKIEGISKEEFQEKFHKTIEEVFENEISKLKKMKLIEEDIDRDKKYIKLSKKGIDFANIVWQEFVN